MITHHSHHTPARLRLAFAAALFLLSVVMPLGLSAQTFWAKHIIRHVGMSEGLPCNFVDDICSDENGIIWMATGSGLVRYDGYSFVTYNCGNTPNLLSNFTAAVTPDFHGNIWVGTDRGICLADTRHDRIMPLLFEEGTDSALVAKLSNSVRRIVVDDNGDIWVASRHSLFCLDMTESGRCRILGHREFQNSVTALEHTSRGIYVCSFADMFSATIDRDERKLNIKQDRRTQFRDGNHVIVALCETNGFLWVGTDRGLYRINFTTGERTVYRHDPSDPHSLSQDRITDIATSEMGQVIVATLKGINIYNYETDSFERITQEDASPGKAIGSNFINCLLPTRDGIWIGTDVAGADIISPVKLNMANTTTEAICGIDPTLAKFKASTVRPINAIVEDGAGTLWVGVVEGGLGKRLRGQSTFEIFNISNHGLCHNSVSALATDGQSKLWVGTWGGGIDVLDLNDKRNRVLETRRDVASLYIGAMHYDSINGGLWVASTVGIQFIDADGKIHNPLPFEATRDMNGALGAEIDGRGRLWVGTSLGLFILDLTKFDPVADTIPFERIRHRLDDPSVEGDPRVTYIHYSKRKERIYVTTNGFGLYVCDATKPGTQFEAFDASDGLANNCAASVAEDADGNIWVSTNNGLCLMPREDKPLRIFTTTDGLLSDCYYWNAAWTSPIDGHIYFGSLSGLTELGPMPSGISSRITRKPVLTSLEVDNATVVPCAGGVLETSIENAPGIEIHESFKSIGVHLSALNYSDPASVRYQYRLDGFSDRWIDLPKNMHAIYYTALSAGDYKLRMRYALTDGVWSEERVLPITVTPYFYKSVWFICLMVVIAGVLVWLAFRLRLRAVERSRKELREQVAERTKVLEKQRDAIEEQRQELAQKNEKLQQQNIYITQQKENILEMTARIQRLSIDKLQFFTNVSHELRSPLTLITGPVRRALSMTEKPEVRQQLELIDRSSRTLLDTVNQLMDFRKVESGGMDLHPISTDIQAFVGNMISPYVAYAAEQGIALNTFFRVLLPCVRIDPDALTKVLANLLSNAIKYSDGAKRVDLFVCQFRRDGELCTYICVRDRGRGIPENEIGKVFDRFYRAGSGSQMTNVSSTGIGLYVTRTIVNQCNGEIEARNNPGGGLSMRVILPTPPGVPQNMTVEEVAASVAAVANVPTDASASVQPDEQASRLTVLVIDDSKDMRTYLRSILQEFYHVVEAQDGVAGLAAMAEHDIDFVIADLMMPVMDGLEFARKVKADFAYSHTPILILTAQTSPHYRTESYRIGVESYLSKPFDEDMLLARIQGIVSTRRSDQRKFLSTLDTADLNIERESDDEKFVQRVTDFVKANFSNPDFSIDDIVAEVGCSKSMLHKKMQSVMGQAPGNFIRTYRLNMAREILASKSNSLNVSQVAYEVGFNDPKYFSRCFAKAFGYPPSMIG